MYEPMGMEDNCEWIIDKKGMEMATGGLNMSMRDYAKVGQLYLNKGKWNGKQIVNEGKIDVDLMSALTDTGISKETFQSQADNFWKSLDGKKSYLKEVPKL